MDTSGLSSSLSLVAFLLVFGYLGLVQRTVSPGAATSRMPEHLRRTTPLLQSLRLAAAVAVVLSAEALALGQLSSSVLLVAAIALDSLALLLVLEFISKLLATRYPRLTSGVITPVRSTLSVLLSRRSREQSVPGEPEGGNGWQHDFQALQALEIAGQEGLVITEQEQAELDARERLMIRSILKLDETTAREIMVPRVDLVAVEVDTPLPEVATSMLERGHSRLPVYSSTIDHVVGVIHSRDLLPLLARSGEYPSLEETMRPAFFIPESKRLDELLKELQEKHVQIALVVDEYGGIEGLVTLEDLLEEIVGEIEDEFSSGVEPQMVPAGDGTMIVDARVPLGDIADLISGEIASEDVDTVGGLVYSALGKVPQIGDEVSLDGLRIEVVSVLGRRIRKLRLTRTGAG